MFSRTFALLLMVAICTPSGQSQRRERQKRVDACIESLSTFATDPGAATPPSLPSDLKDVTLTYFESGCYGSCPTFTMTLSQNEVQFNGHAFVKAEGRRRAKIKPQQFELLVHSWYDGKFFAMRDNYCGAECPNGTVVIVTDIPESAITLKTAQFKNVVNQCFVKRNGRPIMPRPPDQFFKLAGELRALARANGWLR
jgi:hypothetical protein